MPILVASANVCVLVTLECVACVPSLVNFSLNQLKSSPSAVCTYVRPIHWCY